MKPNRRASFARIWRLRLLAERYIRFVLRQRVWVLLACAAITVASGWSISRGVLASSMTKMFFGDNPAYTRYRDLSERFTTSEPMLVAIEEPDLFSPEVWARLDALTLELEQLPWAVRVDSLFNSFRLRGSEDTLEVETWSDVAARAPPKDEHDWRLLKSELRGDELVSGLLLADDGDSLAWLIEVEGHGRRPVETLPLLLDDVRDAFARAGYPRDTLKIAGVIPESVEAAIQAQYSMTHIFPFTALLLVVVVYLLFNQLWPVFITSGVAFLSIAWTFGFSVMLDREINILQATVPAVMMVVAFSDIVHLCSSYLLELSRGGDKHEAIVKSGSEVGVACFFTSVTTLIGFFSLIFVPAPVFRHLGIVLGVGVAIALLMAMTLVPIFFSYLPQPKRTALATGALGGRVVAALTHVACRVSLEHPRKVVAGFAAVLALAVAGTFQLKIESSISERLDEDNSTRKAQKFIAANFGGTNIVDIYLLAQDGDLLDSQRYEAMQNFQEEIEAATSVARVQSLVTLTNTLHHVLAGEPMGTPISGRALLAQYLLLFEMSGGDSLNLLVDEERTGMRMMARLKHTGMVGTAAVGRRIREIGERLFDEGVEILPTGLGVLFGDWIHFIVRGQRRGLLFALLTTTLMMMVAVGRMRAGAVSMIPNALPLLVLGGYLGWAWDTVDSDTMIVAIIGVGISVDDTLHFMTRLRIELRRAVDIRQAITRTFEFSGRPIIQTTIILCLGFAPFATSDYFSTRIMGTLLPMTLCMALLADLLLLPALVELGWFGLKVGDSAS